MSPTNTKTPTQTRTEAYVPPSNTPTRTPSPTQTNGSYCSTLCSEQIVKGTINGIDIDYFLEGDSELAPWIQPDKFCLGSLPNPNEMICQTCDDCIVDGQPGFCNCNDKKTHLWGGRNGGSWTITFFFSQPVPFVDIVISAWGISGDENVTFTTNSGIPTIQDFQSCFTTVVGNTIIGGANVPGPSGTATAAGIYRITGPSNFTTLTLNGNPPGNLFGLQIGICNTTFFPASPTPTPSKSPGNSPTPTKTKTPTPTSTRFVLCKSKFIPPYSYLAPNGNTINITYTSTGDVQIFTDFGVSCGLYDRSTPALYVGGASSPNPTNFTLTFNFSQTVNNVTILIAATGCQDDENFIITTDSGIPTISMSNSCYSTVSGNEILSGGGSPCNLGPNSGGGGAFTISTVVPFTSLTIAGDGGEGGSVIWICSLFQTPQTTPPPTPPPTNPNNVLCKDRFIPPNNYKGVNSTYTTSINQGLIAIAAWTTILGPACSTAIPNNPVISFLAGQPNSGKFGETQFFIVFNFDQPINDIVFVITGTGPSWDELFTFTTNTGIPSISSSYNCYTVITGNQIASGISTPQPPPFVGGGGIFTITNPTCFTSITLSGSGGQAGSIISICDYSPAVCLSNTPTQTPSQTPSPAVCGCYRIENTEWQRRPAVQIEYFYYDCNNTQIFTSTGTQPDPDGSSIPIGVRYTYVCGSLPVVTDVRGVVTSLGSCRDGNPCPSEQPPEVLGAQCISTNVSTFGGSNGSVNLAITGGTPPYTVIYNNSPISLPLVGWIKPNRNPI